MTPHFPSRKLNSRPFSLQEALLGPFSLLNSLRWQRFLHAFALLVSTALPVNFASAQSPPLSAAPTGTVAKGPNNQPANSASKIALDTSETLFSVLTAINACGYDYELANSDPIRNFVRADLANVIKQSPEATAARDELCRFYKDKQQPDASHELAQYVSLALNLSAPPQFSTASKASDLPPDAFNILGFVPLLQKFYDAAALHQIWLKHQPGYERQLQSLHEPVSQLIFRTDTYLKLPISRYLGRKFVVYVEPMGPPGQVNARNYGVDYFLAVSPSSNALRLDQIRHTYLHYILDPLVAKRGRDIKKIEPLLAYVQTAPLDDSFKQDISLLVTESLIRAIEARTLSANTPKGDSKALESARNNAAQASMEQGYVLTRYFYEQLIALERDSTGLREALPEWLFGLHLDREKKRAEATIFSAQAAPEPLRASNLRRTQLLDLAEERLSQHDAEGAHRIAQKVLDDQSEDPARAMFIMARAATLNKDIEGARVLFERTLQIAREPRTIAWSHILLARIFDLMCNRETAISHYRSALTSGDPGADTQSAANKGIRENAPGCESSDSDKSNLN